MGDKTGNISLGDVTGTGAGTAVALTSGRSLHMAQLAIYGTFTATIELQVSLDGTNWVIATDVGGAQITGVTTVKGFVIAGDAHAVRTNCTAFTSGTIKIDIQPVAA